VQSFKGVVKPYAQTRPGWKVLRVLGTLLDLPGFDLDTADAARASVLPEGTDVASRLGNITHVEIEPPTEATNGFERVADVPIHFADPLARRSPPLQQSADAAPPRARMNAQTLAQVGATEGAKVKVMQGRGEVILAALTDPGVPAGVVRIAAAHPATCALEGLSGPVRIERA
jgi:NADH-quinone oxidoreductase subunit G